MGGQGVGAMVASVVLAAAVSFTALFHSYTFHIFDSHEEVTVVAMGDMFFDRYIRQVGELRGEDFLFSCIKGLFAEGDMVVGNLEGPITEASSRSINTVIGSPLNYVFTFPTTTATMLKRAGVTAVSLGNNHITNFGYDGLLSTRHYLDAGRVGHFGGVGGDEPVYRSRINNIPIAFVSYNQFGGASVPDVAKLITIEKLSGNIVIVYAHWGEEYSTTTAYTRPVAKTFADAGADAIIGSHPHIVLDHEYIGSTLVYYSLGNFIFDQYFDVKVTNGLALVLTISKDGFVSAEEHPVVLGRDGRTCPA